MAKPLRNPVITRLEKAVHKGDVSAVQRLCASAPEVLRENPRESDVLLSIAIQGAQLGVTLLTPPAEAQAHCEAHRGVFDTLIAHGAHIGPEATIAAADAVHWLFLKELLARGADPNPAMGRLTLLGNLKGRQERRQPDKREWDQPFIDLLVAHGARDGG